MSHYLVSLKRFQLTKSNPKSGFNYLSYAIVKGQFEVATKMLEQLQVAGQVTQEAINPVIRADPEITLMDLCCKKKYRGGIRFLMQRCQIQPNAAQ